MLFYMLFISCIIIGLMWFLLASTLKIMAGEESTFSGRHCSTPIDYSVHIYRTKTGQQSQTFQIFHLEFAIFSWKSSVSLADSNVWTVLCFNKWLPSEFTCLICISISRLISFDKLWHSQIVFTTLISYIITGPYQWLSISSFSWLGEICRDQRPAHHESSRGMFTKSLSFYHMTATTQ